jgi:D-proline reductase (dithiol) PrdB
MAAAARQPEKCSKTVHSERRKQKIENSTAFHLQSPNLLVSEYPNFQRLIYNDCGSIHCQGECMSSSDGLRQRIYRFVGALYSRIPTLARGWGKRFDALQFSDVPFAPMRVPLNRATLALITTGGVHLRDQQPFDMADPRGDATFRIIPANTPREQITITHDYYDHSDAEKDLNILFPLDMINRLVQVGCVGALATSYGFMGHIEPPHVETLIHKTAPQVAGMLKQERVDAVLLTPA